MNPTFTALVAKDLYLNRWTIPTLVLAGLFSLSLCLISITTLLVGGLAYLAGLIAFGCIQAMSIWKDRENGALLFSLSLPVSRRGYLTARALGALLTYLAVWAPLVAAGVATVLLSSVIPHGALPFLVLLMVFLLMEFCLLMGVALTGASEGIITAFIIVTNTAVSLYWWGVATLPSMVRTSKGPEVIWDRTSLGLLILQIVLCVLFIAVPIQIGARRREM